MPNDQLIFVGYEVTENLRAGFAAVAQKDRVYLEDPAFLETVDVGGRSYIGKRAESNAPADRLQDVARNVVSLVSRAMPTAQLKVSDALVLAIEAQGETVPDPEESEDPVDVPVPFEYANLID